MDSETGELVRQIHHDVLIGDESFGAGPKTPTRAQPDEEASESASVVPASVPVETSKETAVPKDQVSWDFAEPTYSESRSVSSGRDSEGERAEGHYEGRSAAGRRGGKGSICLG